MTSYVQKSIFIMNSFDLSTHFALRYYTILVNQTHVKFWNVYVCVGGSNGLEMPSFVARMHTDKPYPDSFMGEIKGWIPN